MPPFAFVRRREPDPGREYVLPTNVLFEEPIIPQGAPDAVRPSDYWQDGKPPILAKSHARVAFTLRPASIRSVANDSFIVGKVKPAMNVILTPAGGQNPLNSRANISRPTPVTNGDITISAGGLQGYAPRGGIPGPGGLTYTDPRQVP